ncbi:MAG: ABC transporter ATP-binding protein [Gaiellaceae bacterium]
MASIVLEELTKVYPDGTLAVDRLSLEVGDGEFVVLVGPSGCGKTTALRMVAGLEQITAGTLRIGDRVVNHLGARNRDVAMVFQNYALYPHMDVAANIAFGLKMRKVPKGERDKKVAEAARVLGLTDLLARKPRQLSGGQRQRVAMGRAIVREPQAFLMDEPLSNLDAKLRVQMRAEIARIQRDIGATTLYVTHDQTEAMTMADRVAVMRHGLLQQLDVPQALYDNPANLFVASFIGSPPINLVEGEIVADGSGLQCRFGAGSVHLPAASDRLRAHAGGSVAVGIRPEALHEAAPTEENVLRGTVKLVEALGPEVLVYIDVDVKPVAHEQVVEGAVVESADVELVAELRARASATVVARVGQGAHLQAGQHIVLGVDTTKLHYFDLETGTAL